MELASASLVSLPTELIHHISMSLSVADILACSLTCHYLRATLNDNMVWKKYLPIKECTSSLEAEEQHVLPVFQGVDSPTPLCSARLEYIRQMRLLKNWREGKYVEYCTKTTLSYADARNNTRGIGQMIFKGKYLFMSRFLNDDESDAIEVWDILMHPYLFTSLDLKHCNYDVFFIIRSYLVIIRNFKAVVYQINLPDKDFPIVYSFSVMEDVLDSKKGFSIMSETVTNEWIHSITGQYLFSNKRTDDENIFHVWDIVNATKIGSFSPPVKGNFTILHSSLKNDLYFKQSMVHGGAYVCYSAFNIEKKTFYETVFACKSLVRYAFFYKSHIVLFEHDTNELVLDETFHCICKVFDFTNGTELSSRCLKYLRPIQSIPVVNDTLILVFNGYFHILNILTLESINQFQCANILYICDYFHFVDGSVFVMTCSFDKKFELWDIKKEEKLSFFQKECRSHIYFDDLLSKLIVYDHSQISAIHFW